MTEPTYPAWIEAAPEPKRTIYKIRYEEEELARDLAMRDLRQDQRDSLHTARVKNRRILKLRRQLREMRGEQ